MVGEGHLGGDTGAEAAESGTQNSNTGTEGRASPKARGCEEPTRQVWLTQSKKRMQATVRRGFLEAQAEVELEKVVSVRSGVHHESQAEKFACGLRSRGRTFKC